MKDNSDKTMQAMGKACELIAKKAFGENIRVTVIVYPDQLPQASKFVTNAIPSKTVLALRTAADQMEAANMGTIGNA